MNKKKESNSLLEFLAGIAMLSVGGYWLLSAVTVSTNFFNGFHIGKMNMSGGLVVVPFIVGIIMLFFNFESLAAKIVIGAGLLIILGSIIYSTSFRMNPMALYDYLIILIGIFGGAALILKVLTKPLPGKEKE